MKVSEYRCLSTVNTKVFENLCQLILQNKIWCYKLDALNDENELSRISDYAPAVPIHSQALMRHSNTPTDQAPRQA
jgi:hypothetical protein